MDPVHKQSKRLILIIIRKLTVGCGLFFQLPHINAYQFKIIDFL
jgi:hypothetical protein